MSNVRIAAFVDRRPSRFAREVVERLRARGARVDVITAIGGCGRPRWVRRLSGRRLQPVPDWIESRGAPAGVCLDLRWQPRPGAAPPSAACWSLAIGSGRFGPPAFAEALGGAAHVEVQLRASQGGASRVTRRGAFPYASTYGRTLDLILRECVSWFDDFDVPAGAPEAEPSPAREPIDVRSALGFAIQELRRIVNTTLRWAFDEARWNIAISDVTPEQFLKRQDEAQFRWLGHGRESLADPFPVHLGGRLKILCEDIGSNRIGHISAIDANGDEMRATLLNGSHVSYPFVYRTREKTYILPERSSTGKLDLYEIVGEKAIFVATLFADRGLVDPTLTQFEGRFWLFGTDPNRLPNAALHAYWAESLSGMWHPHSRNPIKIDVRSSRPAGNLFLLNGILHRPAQDCSGRYGRAVVINRIDRLDPDGFEETPVARIDPDSLGLSEAVGVHTFSSDGSCVAIDAQFARWWWRKPLIAAMERIRRRKACTK